MNYIPRLPGRNVNVSPRSPFVDFILLLCAFVAILAMLYVALGAIADSVFARLPARLEFRIAAEIARYIPTPAPSESDSDLYALFDSLCSRMPDPSLPYRLHVAEDSTVNAVALPGGHVVVFRGLLDSVPSTEQRAFVLAHELGHFHNRDHIRGLGRSLVLMMVAGALLGPENPVTQMASATLLGTHNRTFSQRQELSADTFAVDLVYRTLGSVDEALGFFDRFISPRALETFRYFFSSHPDPSGRARVLRQYAQARGYLAGP